MTIRSQITIPTSIFPTTYTMVSPAYIPPIFNHTHYTIHSSYNTFLYTQNSLNTHTTNYWSTIHHIQHHQSMQLHGHSTPQTLTSTSTCTMGFWEYRPLGRHTTALRYKSHATRNTWYNYTTPFNTHPNPQSPQTIHNTQVHTTIPKHLQKTHQHYNE